MKQFLLGATALVMTAGVSAPAMAEYDLTILHTNDFHSRIEPINKYDAGCSEKKAAEGKCFGGSARLETAINERRAASKNSILVDGGDQFQGSLFYTHYKGQAAAKFMKELGYEVMTVGNHEFDDGPEALRKFADAIDFPLLLANADYSKEPLLKDTLAPSTIIEKNGEKIGFIGVAPIDTGDLASAGVGVTFSDPIEAVKKEVAALEAQGVNKIILLSHSGYGADQRFAKEVDGVDVIIGGHDNTYLSNTSDRAKGPYPTWGTSPNGKKVAIVQAYAFGKFLGELNVKFDDNGDLIEAVGEPIIMDKNVAEDAAIKAQVAEMAKPLDAVRNEVVGKSLAVIDGDRKSCRARECEMGNLVADAILAATKDNGIQIVLQNGGGLRASIDEGDVTMGEVLTVLPFKNTLATFKLKGKDIVVALENGLSKLEENAGRFTQVAGIKYSFDSTKPAGERVVSVEMADGSKFDPEAIYGVASNNYMRTGGDGYKILATNSIDAYDFGPGLEFILADYFKANKDGFKPFLDGRITKVK